VENCEYFLVLIPALIL